MGFLKSLFGRPGPKAEEPTRDVAPAKLSNHPNTPSVEIPELAAPERNRWVVPDGIVVLNGKSWNQLRTVPIESEFTGDQLRARLGDKTNHDISPIQLATEGSFVAAYEDGTRLGVLTGEAAARIAPVVREWTERGWEVRTWGKIDGMDGRRSRLVAVIPTAEQPLYADAYDSSFLFPTSKVMARRKTPEGKTEYEEYLRRVEANRPRSVTISFGATTLEAYLVNWGGSGRWERRGLQVLHPESGTYVWDDDIDEIWASAGIKATYLAGAEHNRDSARPEFNAGRLVSLVPEPDNSYDRNAVAVRSLDGRYKAGYVPKDEAPKIGRALAARPLVALIQWEQREPGARFRQRFRLLIGPAPLTVEPDVTWDG